MICVWVLLQAEDDENADSMLIGEDEYVAAADDAVEDSMAGLSEAQRKAKLDFERRRKAHYNEFEAVRRARQLMEQEEDEDDD